MNHTQYQHECLTHYDSNFAACDISWQLFPSQLSYGGVLLPSVTSENECKNTCIQNNTCLAIDFNKDLQCYLHLSPDYADNIITNRANVNQSVLTRNCPSSTGPTALITISMFRSANFTETYIHLNTSHKSINESAIHMGNRTSAFVNITLS